MHDYSIFLNVSLATDNTLALIVAVLIICFVQIP